MSAAISLLGIILGLVLLIVLAYKGHSIIWVAPVCAALVALLGGMHLLQTYLGDYVAGTVSRVLFPVAGGMISCAFCQFCEFVRIYRYIQKYFIAGVHIVIQSVRIGVDGIVFSRAGCGVYRWICFFARSVLYCSHTFQEWEGMPTEKR